MAISKKLIGLLDEKKLKYEIIGHRIVFTAFDKAMTLEVKPAQVAKTLVISIDRDYGIVVVGAHRNLDFKSVKKAVNALRKKAKEKSAKNIAIAKEKWIEKNMKGVKPGAVPPLGVLWKLPTFIDKGLLKEKKIIINAGNHEESVMIKSKDFMKIAPDAILGNFSKIRK
jgi:prolyl-tRNA editing enzyme YbaK/EbsC (Cys-tRNA(Pro) deacylase)